MKWAIIGLGGAGTGHARTIGDVDGIQLAGGFDPMPAARTRFAEDFAMHVHEKLDPLLADDSIAGVTIAASSGAHAELAMQALRAGKHVLVEKPFAHNAEAAGRMVKTAMAVGRVVAPYHNRRYDPDFRMVREVLAGGQLGKIRRISSSVGGPHPNTGWRAIREMGGGRLYDWGPHLLDQILSLNAGEVAGVSGVMFVPAGPGYEGDADEYFRADLRFANGLDATVEMIGFAFIPPVRWTIYGETGSLQITGNIHAEFTMTVCSKDAEPQVTTTTRAAEVEKHGSGGSRIYEQLRDHILGKGNLSVTAEDGVRCMRIIDAVRRSAEVEHRSVSVQRKTQ